MAYMHVAQLIDGIRPDTDDWLQSAAIRKPELLVTARLVLLSAGVDIGSRREAMVLLRWCAAQQPVAPRTKVMEEVEFLTSQAQHSPWLQTKQWAGLGLAMLACQDETRDLVIKHSAGVLSHLILEVLTQQGVDLHMDILAQCADFITYVTQVYTEKQLASMCTPLQVCDITRAVTEQLVTVLGGGGAAAVEACQKLQALLMAQPQAAAAVFSATEGAGGHQHGVAAVVAALRNELDRDTDPAPGSDNSSAASNSAGKADEILEGGGVHCWRTQGLSASLLSLLGRLLEQASAEPEPGALRAATTAAFANEDAVSLLLRCLELGSLPGVGGADAMQTLAVLLYACTAQPDLLQLLSAEGAVDAVASQWRHAPAAAAHALWHMRDYLSRSEQPQGGLQYEALLQLLGHPACSCEEDTNHSIRRYRDALECVKAMAGRWAKTDQAGPPTLAALDLAWGHIQELKPHCATSGCEATLMELWALLSSHTGTAAQQLQLALTVEATAAEAMEGELQPPCCVRAALDTLKEDTEAGEKALSSHLALLLNLLRAGHACTQQLQPIWIRHVQLQGSFLNALHLQLQCRLQHPAVGPEPPDLEALQLCTQLCLISCGDGALAQLPPLTPHMLLPSTYPSSSAQDESGVSGAGVGSVEGPAAPWCPLDVLKAKLGLMQRLRAGGGTAAVAADPTADSSSVVALLLPLLLSGPLAADTPLPPSDYTQLLDATPGAMHRQVLELLRQAAEEEARRCDPSSCSWVQGVLDQALDAARSCKGGQPCKQQLANCVAVAALWLDVALPEVEVSDAAALDLHLQAVQTLLHDHGLVPSWAVGLLQLLLECPAAADAVVPTAPAPASSTVLQVTRSILELLCLQLHSSGPLPGLTPLESYRWFLPGGKLRDATPEQCSLLALMATAVDPAGDPLATVEEPGGSSGAARSTEPPQETVVHLPAGSSLRSLHNFLPDAVAAATGPCVFDLGGQTLSGDLEGDIVIKLGHTLQNGALKLPPKRQLIINAGADVKVSLRALTITGSGPAAAAAAGGTEVSGLVRVVTGHACLDSCTIADPSEQGCCVLLVDGGAAASAELLGCTLRGAQAGRGLVVKGSGSRAVATGCKIHGNQWSNVRSTRGGDVTLEGCKVYNSKNAHGLAAYDSGSTAVARGCEIYSNKWGNAQASGGGEVTLDGCKVYDCKNGSGLAAKGSGSRAVAMVCKIYNNKRGTILSSGGGEVTLEGCQLFE